METYNSNLFDKYLMYLKMPEQIIIIRVKLVHLNYNCLVTILKNFISQLSIK